MDWETLLHTVIQGPRLMEILPSSGFYGYLNISSISSQKTARRRGFQGGYFWPGLILPNHIQRTGVVLGQNM